MDQFDGHLYVITRHAHLNTSGQFANAGNVGGSEVELRTIVVEERSMTSTFILGQNVYLSGKLSVAGNSTGLSQNLSSFDFSSLDTTKQSTDVITSLCLIQHLTEHFDTGYNSLLGLFLDTNDFNFIIQMQNTTLYTTGSNGTTTGNGEYVLDGHQERLISITLRIRDIRIYSIHQFHDLVAPLAAGIFQSLQSGTLDDRAVIEVVLFQLLGYFHLNQLDQLGIVNHITLVQEYDDVRNAYLTGQKDVLLGLSHNTISSSYNEDSTIHLCSTGDHVLNVVSMARAVNVCIVSLLGLVLDVSGRNGNTTLSLFGSLIDVIEVNLLVTRYSLGKNLGDCSGQSSFTMVNVTDGTNVTMGLCSVKFSFSHYLSPP